MQVPEGKEMSEALKAAMESAMAKSAAGSSATDTLRPDEHPLDTANSIGDLTTNYMGVRLDNPLIASAGPIQQTLDGLTALSEAGVGGIVMFSLFEEQIRHEEAHRVSLVEGSQNFFAEAMSFFPTQAASQAGITTNYLRLLETACSRLNTPIFASINGTAVGSWVSTARQMEEAGAQGIELNIYYVAGDSTEDDHSVEQRHLDVLAAIKQQVSVPVAVKLNPFVSAFAHFATDLDKAGADALVLFNRFVQPDIDIERQRVVPGVELSTTFEGRLPRTWISVLYGRVSASLALTSGVATAADVVKGILAGADVVMTTSSLLHNGPGYVQTLLDGLTGYLARKQLTLRQLRGMLAIPASAPISEYERSGYLSAIEKGKARFGR